MNRDKLWKRFLELLSLDLHDGKVVDALKRPAVNFHGSAASYKKFFDQAWTDMEELAKEQRRIPDWDMKATKESFCRACGETIKVGEEITFWGAPDDPGRIVHRKHPRKGHAGECGPTTDGCFLKPETTEHHFDVGGEG